VLFKEEEEEEEEQIKSKNREWNDSGLLGVVVRYAATNKKTSKRKPKPQTARKTR
jgi:hypothetical protein